MQLEVTREAAGRIRRKTGELYVWQESFAPRWATDETSFDRPDGLEFRKHADAGVDVYVAHGIRADRVRVERERWPWRGVKVFVDGKRWGRRGRAAGETAFDFGGAGPP